MRRGATPESRLLGETLRPQARAFGGVLALLLVALGIKLALPILLARFVDDAIGGAGGGALGRIAIAYIVLALLAEAIGLAVIWASVHLSWRAGNQLRERLAGHASRLELAWHSRYSPGQLIERIDGDVEAMVVFFTNVLVHVIGNLILTVGMLAVAFAIDVRAGLLLTVAAICGATVMIRVRLLAVPAREAEREANAVLYGDLEERLGGLEDLRANGAGRYAVHRLHQHSSVVWHRSRRASLLSEGSYAGAAITFAAGSVSMLALGFVLEADGVISVGQVLALFRYAELLRQPLEVIAEQLKEFQKAVAGARRASSMLATEPRIRSGDLGDDALSPGASEVRFDAVTFAYDDVERPVLADVDLVLPPGTTVGVIGRTGSGKTTLGRLVARLWDVDAGAVRLDGVDVRDLRLDVLRRRTAVVTQDVEIVRATVRDNITLFGQHDADDEAIVAVVERVGLAAWLAATPHGLDTELDGASSLSAGEAQLLAFARVLLESPSVVILDEASSRLDPDTEARLTAATADLVAGRTAIIIAHRLETLATVDLIAVVDDGRVVEFGPRPELAADPTSRYAQLLARDDAGVIDDALATIGVVHER